MNESSPLRNIRKLKGFSLQYVCAQVGVDNGHLSRIERGGRCLRQPEHRQRPPRSMRER